MRFEAVYREIAFLKNAFVMDTMLRRKLTYFGTGNLVKN
jgi:hypothetical protein